MASTKRIAKTEKPSFVERVKAINWVLVAVFAWTRLGVLPMALWFSAKHIGETGHRLGLHAPTWAVVLFIDGFAVLGMVCRSRHLSDVTRKAARVMQICAGMVSLVANVYAGQTLGDRMFGGLVVAAVAALEIFGEHLSPAKTDAEREAEAKALKRREAAARGVATKARKAAAAKREARAEAKLIAKMVSE